MFSVSFDDINWDPTISDDAPSKISEPPPDLDFTTDFGAFIDADFSFPEDDLTETRTKKTRTEESAPFFKSPFKQSSNQNNNTTAFANNASLNHPFDLDDLLGIQSSLPLSTTSSGGLMPDLIPTDSFDTVSTEDQFSSDDVYDSETTSEYSCDDPLMEEAKWTPSGGVMGGKMNSKLAASSEWANFDFDSVHDVFEGPSSRVNPRSRSSNKMKKKSNSSKAASSHGSKSSTSGGSNNKRGRKDSEDDNDSTTRRRRRRKVDMEQLRARIASLIAKKHEQEPVESYQQEEMSVREAILGTFFHYRSTNMLDKTRWRELVSEDFSLMLPRTLYRAQREDSIVMPTANPSSINTEATVSSDSPSKLVASDEDASSPSSNASATVSTALATNHLLSNIMSDVRNVFGIDALVSDTSSVHSMVEVIRSRVRAQRPELARKRAAGFALNLSLDDKSMKQDENTGSFKATWRMSTHGLISAGFSSECAVNGEASMRFDADYKLVSVELEFDATSFGCQLQRHKLLDPNQLARQSLSLGLAGAVNGAGKIAIGARGAGGVLAPAPLPVGSRPSAAFMRSFGQACAAVKQATEASTTANGGASSTSSSAPPSAHRVMQMMALNMQMMQAGGAGGVLLPGGAPAAAPNAGTAANKKSKSVDSVVVANNSRTPSPTTASPPLAAAPASMRNVSVYNKQGKKRPASAIVTEVDTAAADSLDLFKFTRTLNQAPPPVAPIATTTTTCPSTPSTSASVPPQRQLINNMSNNLSPFNNNNNTSSSSLPNQQNTTKSTQSTLLPTHLHPTPQSSSMVMPQFPFMNGASNMLSNDGNAMRNFTMPTTSSYQSLSPTSTSSNTGNNNPFPSASTPSHESILSLFPYGLPTSVNPLSTGCGQNNSSSNGGMPTPLSAAQLSQMFGLLQNNAALQQTGSNPFSNTCTGASSSQQSAPNTQNPFLSFFPSHLTPNAPFPTLTPPSFSQPPIAALPSNLPRTN